MYPIYFLTVGSDTLIMSLLYLCFSFFIGIFVFYLLHAVFVLIFGKILGYEFLSFTLYFIYIKKENGKITVSTGNPQFFVNCGMIKPERTNADTVLYNLLPTIANLVLIPILWKICVSCELPLILKNAVPYYGLCAFLNLALVGQMIYNCFSKSPKAVMWRKEQYVTNKLNAGTRPREIDIDEVEIPRGKLNNILELRYYLFLYYHYLDSYDYEKMGRIIELFEANIGAKNNDALTPYIYEVIFYTSFVTGDTAAAQSYYFGIEANLLNDKDINGRRVYAYYLYHICKDKDKALEAARAGLEVADKFPHKGLAEMEKELLENLIAEI